MEEPLELHYHYTELELSIMGRDGSTRRKTVTVRIVMDTQMITPNEQTQIVNDFVLKQFRKYENDGECLMMVTVSKQYWR